MQTAEQPQRPFYMSMPKYHSWSGYQTAPMTPEQAYTQDGYFSMQAYQEPTQPMFSPFAYTPYMEPMYHQHPMQQWQIQGYYTSAPMVTPISAPSVCHCTSGHVTPAALGSPLQPATPLSISPRSAEFDTVQDVSFDYFDAALQYQNDLCLPLAEEQLTPTEEMVIGLGISFKEPSVKVEQQLNTPPTTPRKLSRATSSDSPVIRRKWTAEEDEALADAVAKYASCSQKWKKVAAAVGNRHAKLCAKRWDYLDRTAIKGVKRGRWTYDEDVVLSQLVRDWTATREGKINWNTIASQLPRLRSGTQAQARYTETLDPSIKKGWWTPEEIVALQAAIERFGTCWRQVAQEVPGRTQRQCRMRYLALAGSVSEPEEELLHAESA